MGELKNQPLAIKDFTLIKNNKRGAISNVGTMIPNKMIADALKSDGVTMLAHISGIRASTNSKQGRSHITSFRPQFYIKEKDEHQLPETLQLTFDSTTYWTTIHQIHKQTRRVSLSKRQNQLSPYPQKNNPKIILAPKDLSQQSTVVLPAKSRIISLNRAHRLHKQMMPRFLTHPS